MLILDIILYSVCGFGIIWGVYMLFTDDWYLYTLYALYLFRLFYSCYVLEIMIRFNLNKKRGKNDMII